MFILRELLTLFAKNKFSHYRRFELDVWGVCFTDVRAKKIKYSTTEKELITIIKSPYFKFFYKIWKKRKLLWESRRRRYIYRLDLLPPDKPKKRMKLRFLSIRLTRLYFITLQDHQFRELLWRAKKLDGILSKIIIIL